jgi:predicted dehydrogenase
MTHPTDRRSFLKYSSLAGASIMVPSHAGIVRSYANNEKLNVGIIGAGGKGRRDADGVASENIVALCDVDDRRAAGTYKKYPGAKRYSDYRVMMDREKLDAVVISTPDHSHAPAASIAIQKGLHVYCQKPLTHTVEEARLLKTLAAKHKVSTSMGNQGTGMDGFRQAVEVVRSGAIGDVTELYVWTNRPVWKQGVKRDNKIEAIPAGMRWDLFLGPAPYRPYQSKYTPFNWRGFWDFGTGALGDMGCHILNMPFMALDLGSPSWVEAESEGMTDDSGPVSSTVVYQFPQRGKKPPVRFTWSDGGKKPSVDLVPGAKKLANGGSIMVGTKGVMYSTDDYGQYFQLLPKEKFQDYKPPTPSLQRARGGAGDKIYNEWIDDCKGGPRCLANFDYAADLTETVLLGNVAIRAAEKINWDSVNLRATNCPKAEEFIRKEYSWGFGID